MDLPIPIHLNVWWHQDLPVYWINLWTWTRVLLVLGMEMSTLDLFHLLIPNPQVWYSTYLLYHQTDLQLLSEEIEVFKCSYGDRCWHYLVITLLRFNFLYLAYNIIRIHRVELTVLYELKVYSTYKLLKDYSGLIVLSVR